MGVVASALAVAGAELDIAGALRDDARPRELLRFGNALSFSGRHEEARACHAHSVRLHPGFADSYFELGEAHRALGEDALALRAMETGLKLTPHAAHRHRDHGTMLQGIGRLSEARAAYARALTWSPSDADAYFNLGTAHETSGEYDAALSAYRSALELDPPDEARVHNNLGGVLLAQGHVDKALAAYSEAVDADDNFADGRYNLGNALLVAGRHAEAQSQLRMALKLAPGHPKAERKLEQVRAAATQVKQKEAEAAHELGVVEVAVEACADDGACLESRVARARERRDADGPLIV